MLDQLRKRWKLFIIIRTEYGEIRSISPYSVRIRENTDEENSQYGHHLCSAFHCFKSHKKTKTKKIDEAILSQSLNWVFQILRTFYFQDDGRYFLQLFVAIHQNWHEEMWVVTSIGLYPDILATIDQKAQVW